MGIIDWIILVLFTVFLIIGLRRGFAGMVVQLLGYLATFILLGQYYPLLRNSLILKYKFDFTLSTIIAIILIIILIGVIARLVIFFLDRTLKLMRLSTMNKFFGALFGLFNALLIVMIFSVLLDFIPSLSKPLKDPAKHRVYYQIDQIKKETFNTFKLNQRLKLPGSLSAEESD
ncbi:MAG TPA: CvpA family protein [Candidatus Cloacimonadota bacterium]|nr:CvpA family protein [Candidatus Cloacimonadota bacterium]